MTPPSASPAPPASPPPSSSPRPLPLVLLRHGRSEWNIQNRFTGWEDVPLAPQGEEDARKAAARLKSAGLTFDFAACSMLKRAIATLWAVQREMDLMWLPAVSDWRLNERHYGALQGQNKKSAAEKFGEEQVRIWRRGYDRRPPPVESPAPPPDHRYAKITPPTGESLVDTRARVSEFYDEKIAPRLALGERCLIVAHGNALRALTMRIDNADDSGEGIDALEIPIAVPVVYHLDDQLRPLSREFLD